MGPTAPISLGFLEREPDQVVVLAQTAQTFGQWPSDLLTMTPMLRRFNLAAAGALWEAAAKSRESGEESCG